MKTNLPHTHTNFESPAPSPEQHPSKYLLAVIYTLTQASPTLCSPLAQPVLLRLQLRLQSRPDFSRKSDLIAVPNASSTGLQISCLHCFRDDVRDSANGIRGGLRVPVE